MGGAVINWLKDELKLIDDAEESEYYGSKVEDTNGVYFVPAFVGLGAPYWDMYARGTIVGLSRGANRNHIVRAALESIAFQTKDVVKSMEKDLNINIRSLMADGGATKNNLLMQFQADILGVEVKRSLTSEVTALGAAFLSGLSTGFWRDKNELLEKSFSSKSYFCEVTEKERDKKYYNWVKAVERSKNWENSIIK
jgi:glycerol kinase